jgi:hypothetical protein
MISYSPLSAFSLGAEELGQVSLGPLSHISPVFRDTRDDNMPNAEPSRNLTKWKGDRCKTKADAKLSPAFCYLEAQVKRQCSQHELDWLLS